MLLIASFVLLLIASGSIALGLRYLFALERWPWLMLPENSTAVPSKPGIFGICGWKRRRGACNSSRGNAIPVPI